MLTTLLQEHTPFVVLFVAITLEYWLPIFPGYHPKYLLDLLITNLVKRIYKPEHSDPYQVLSGALSLLVPLFIVLLPVYGILAFASYPEAISAFILYLCLEHRQIEKVTKRVTVLMKQNQKSAAKDLLRTWLRRDTSTLSEPGIIKATIETLILRIGRHYFSVLMLFLLFGIYGALTYRLLTIIHNNWSKYCAIGVKFVQPVAKLLYLLEWLPIRVMVCTILLLKETSLGIKYIKFYGSHCYQINSGWLLSCISAALKIQLGGPAIYHNVKFKKIRISQHRMPVIADIERTQTLLNKVKLIWFSFFILYALSRVILSL